MSRTVRRPRGYTRKPSRRCICAGCVHNLAEYTDKVRYHQDPESKSWWAESDNAPGWMAVADSRDELDQLVSEGLHFFLTEQAR